MRLKLFLAAATVAAVAVGLMLPTPKARQAEARSQIPTMQVGPG